MCVFCCYLKLKLGNPARQPLALMSRVWRRGAVQPTSTGGAAQPTSTPGGAAQPTFSVLPDDVSELTVAFYNVGIPLSQVGAKKWHIKEKGLAADIVQAAKVHALDILCLSKLGQVGEGIGEKLPGADVDAWIRKLLADSGVSPVDIYADAHYATLVLSDRVKVLGYRIIRDFIETQRDLCFQHFRVRTSEREEPISIVNCHAPSSRKRNLSAHMRTEYFTACHEACAGDPFIWGGDFNTGLVHLATILESIDARYTSGSLQTVFSHIGFKHGDLAVTFGLCSAQVNSNIGASFNGVSDNHDVVVTKVFGNRSRSAPRPEPEASSSSSAAQPGRQESAGSALPPPPSNSRHCMWQNRGSGRCPDARDRSQSL